MYGVCKICGCTEKDPCFHPDWGMCWWVNTTHDLCSHCADPDIANDPETTHRVNSTGMSGDCCSDLSDYLAGGDALLQKQIEKNRRLMRAGMIEFDEYEEIE